MKIVNIVGGLGNQMFQYAFFHSLSKQSKCDVKLDISDFKQYALHNGYELDRIFKVNCVYATKNEIYTFTSHQKSFLNKLMRKLHLRKSLVIKESNDSEFCFDESVLTDLFPQGYYKGYWQSYKYFKDYKNDLLEIFKFPDFEIGSQNHQLKSTLECKQSVSIHIRRGDYVNHPLLGGVCEKEYYQKAINLISSKVNNPLFIIFSNDIEWARKNLSIRGDIIFVDWNEGNDSYKDMHLMSLCKHNIIANSSFSWWGAWLNSNPKKIVIAPRVWTNEVGKHFETVPVEWVKI